MGQVSGLHWMPTAEREHRASPECWCEPTVDAVVEDDEGNERTIWLHRRVH